MRIRVVDNIRALPEAEWNAVAGDRIVLTHAWQRIMEESAIGYHPRYVLLEDEAGPAALCIAPHWDGGPLWERLLLRRSLRIFAPYGASASGIATRPGVALQSVLDALEEALGELRRAPLCLVSTVTVSAREDADALASHGYQTLPLAPDSVLDLEQRGGVEGYVEGMTPRDRRFLGRGKRLLEKHGLEMVTEPVRGSGAGLYELYLRTAWHHGLPRGEPPPFNERLFQSMSTHLGERARLFECRGRQDGQPRLFFMGAVQGPQLIVPFAGLRYGTESLGSFYRLGWYEVVMWALRQGVRYMHAGTTNYELKQSLGCRLAPRWMCYRANSPLLQPLVARARPLVERLGYRAQVPVPEVVS